MSVFKDAWTLETAMKILQHQTVDSKTWAEAVEWLLIYGPPDIKEMLGLASSHATTESFPELQPKGYDADGRPCYSLSDLASSLQISEEEAARLLAEKEAKHDQPHFIETETTTKLQ